MLKKVSIFLMASFVLMQAHAQKSNIQSAINYLKDKEIESAKKMIDEAVNNESTKSSSKAWLLKAVIYQAIGTPKEMMPQMTFMLNQSPYIINLEDANALRASTPDALSIALDAFKKAISFDAKYNKDEVMPLVSNLLSVQYNNAINKMNENQFAAAYTEFEVVREISKLDEGKLWKGIGPGLDTAFANARMYQANCAYNAGKDEDAVTLLEECIKNPITQNPDLYIMLSDLYSKTNQDAKWAETMKIARTKYPNEKRLLTNEINYYIEKGKAEESIAKLKEGIKLEPQKADLYLLLGQTYLTMANPTDKSGKAIGRPTNAKELEQDALGYYQKAAELDIKNPYPPYNIGLIHYNQAKLITDEMNDKNTDNKRYEALKPGRDELINKAIPFFTKAKELMEYEKNNESYKSMYRENLTGLMNAYNVTNQTEKAAGIKKLLEAK
jgi:hypothetical protein